LELFFVSASTLVVYARTILTVAIAVLMLKYFLAELALEFYLIDDVLKS
jgi:hypothetical protein